MAKMSISMLTEILIGDLKAEPNIKPSIVLYDDQISVSKDCSADKPAPDLRYKILVNESEVARYYNKYLKNESKEELSISLADAIIENLI